MTLTLNFRITQGKSLKKIYNSRKMNEQNTGIKFS